MTKNTTIRTTKRYDNYIVAIGASAGGLEAIHEFFDNMASNNSFSFVVIQHLSSDYKSLLVELVGKHTHMKVFEAANDMAVQQDCVYIIPNDKLMTVDKGRLKLANKSAVKAPNTAIDHFLFTLAKDKGEKAIAVILSGTGTDGTKGIQAIKEHGGMVIVQEPSSAKFDGMPNSAIASGNADFVLLPSEINKELFNHINEEPIKVLEKGKINEKLLDEIFALVYQQSGNDFNLYKTPTIIRRIGRRMNEHEIRNLDDYLKLLRKSPNEVAILGQDFLIGVTKFFRDTEAFKAFNDQIIKVVERKNDGETLKIWVCACSTGQEAYTIALLANECVEKSGKKIEIKIFASDIDEKSIEIAAKNQYPHIVKKEIPARLFKKYFQQDGKFYGVIPEVRKQIVFAKHDVSKSPPFIKNDIVTCRNMLIYMNSLLQEKILSVFHFSLVQGGYLFLGSSETASSLKNGLGEISSKHKIYQKTGAVNYANYNTYGTNIKPTLSDGKKVQKGTIGLSPIEQNFNNFITGKLGYVAIYIDSSYIMQDAIGDYRKYLSLPEGKIELNILKMVPKQAAIILNTGLRKAWKENDTIHLRGVRFDEGNSERYLNISVQPPDPSQIGSATMIIFSEHTVEAATEKVYPGMFDFHDGNQNEYIFELEAELNETRGNLQMAVEEMETTNEELQSTNEELLSANEELQSSNEELQSLNEELHTLNTEHQLKIKELIDLNDDLDNYFRSADIGQIFVDAGMYIRKFNAAAIGMVNLIEADVGRSIEHISNNVKTENLNGDIQQVLSTNRLIEKEIQLKNGDSCLMRIMPYVRKDKKTDGVVITFVDISKLTELNNIISGVFNASRNGVLAFKSIRNKQHSIIDFECIALNDPTTKILKRDRKELMGGRLLEQLPELTNGNLAERYINVVEKGTPLQYEFKFSDSIWLQLVAVKMSDGFAATLTDITSKKQAEEKIKRNYNELLGTRENLKKLNAELELKVTERTKMLSQSEERFSLVSKATNDTVWDWNLASNTMWRNDNFTRMFGYEDELKNENISFYFGIIHDDDRDRVRKSVYESINNSKPQWTAQYRLKRADGTYATILDRGSIILDENKIPYRMVGSILDISVLADTETKLNSTERKFRKIFDSNVIGMIFTNLESGKIENANQIFLDMLGYSWEDFEKNSINWQELTPQEFMPISNISSQLLKDKGFCPPFEKQYLTKNGGTIDVLVGSAILDEENGREAVTYIIDISKQKKNELRRNDLQKLVKKQQDEFYSIFQKAPALITIRRGPQLVYEFVNEAFQLFDGLESYIGKPVSKNSQFATDTLRQIEQKVIENGEAYIANAYKLRKSNEETGEFVDSWFDLIMNPVFSSEGVIDGISFFGFEVTDLVIAQQTTKDLMNKKDEFMSIASHELKTPITSIRGFLQFAIKMASSEKFDSMSALISKADRQVGKLKELVEDLLDVTKIQSGKMTFNFSPFNIAELIAETLEGIQDNLSKHVVLTDIEDVEVNADRNRIEQVISNFLSNGIKYSPNGKEIFVSAKKKGERLRVSVKDYGIGIPQNKIEFLFDRFYRVEEAANHFSGLGLGLYISAEVIRRHHGEIGVESKQQEGSEFWFEIPLNSDI
ncbi:chemotaxis protein CheB [Pedobacter xixiisoli]|uniref:Two-component system, chemotaxis family, CheB/CheR fusion protein n=1 Tax=Pedobacter xixiisoli TaxID=1476464 RepID=A0A285ZSD8_9SPHI|nr:chemotaxis protein CheB [Pedobacter xixiisoli]SOD12556.1 two-component system, chemotaxis family, CheB/CheR fusion protein [Pedobacter xixiisoli]